MAGLRILPGKQKVACDLAFKQATLGYRAPAAFFKVFGQSPMSIEEIKTLAAEYQGLLEENGALRGMFPDRWEEKVETWMRERAKSPKEQ